MFQQRRVLVFRKLCSVFILSHVRNSRLVHFRVAKILDFIKFFKIFFHAGAQLSRRDRIRASSFEKKISARKRPVYSFCIRSIDLPGPVNDIVRVGSRPQGNVLRRFHVAGPAERTFFDVPARFVRHDFPDGSVFKSYRLVGFKKISAFVQGLSFVTVRQEPEVPYSHQPLGQDVEKEAADELDGVDDRDLDVPLRSVLVGEGDFSVGKSMIL